MNTSFRVQLSKISRVMFWVQLVCLCAVLSQTLTPNRASGQASTAAINGRVLDSSGGVVPEAQVDLQSVSTGVVRRTLTNTAGNYVFLNILPGNYSLEVTKAGFRASKLEAFQLVVNQTASFDITLALGKVTEAITVAATGAALEASTAELGSTVTSRPVVDLPLNGRNFTQLLDLTPGISPVDVAATKNGSGAEDGLPIGQFSFPAVNGQTNRSNYFMLDGINDQGASFGTYAVAPIIDAVQEFKVQSHNDQAEFGQVLGGIVNVVTKSGTNDLHGSGWEFLRNSALDARNFFLPSVTPFHQNQFGATVGGPVVLPKLYNGRNRTFFFLAYQGFRFSQASNAYYQVPTAADLQGNLSDVPLPIYNPYTTRPDPSNPGQYIRDGFPNNQIPASMIDPGILVYARATLPAPITTGVGTYNQLDTTQAHQDVEEYSARVDQNIGTNDSIWFRLSGSTQNNPASGGRQTLRSITGFSGQNFGGAWAHTFSPTSTLEVQIGRTRSNWDVNNVFVGVPATLRTDAGFSDNFTANFIGGKAIIPPMNVTGYFSGGEVGDYKKPTRITNEKATYSKMLGSHLFKTGFELSSNTYLETEDSARVVFSNVQTSNPESQGTTGSPLASFLLNIPTSAFRINVNISDRWGGVLGAFFQDQWKVSRRLTINWGLRYDRTFIPQYGRTQDNNTAVGWLDLTRGVYTVQSVPPACSPTVGAPCIPTADGSLPANVEASPNDTLFHDTTDNWQPRVGFAYRLGPKTVIRSGFGIFFDNWAGVLEYATNPQGLWPSVGTLQTSNLNVPTATQLTPSVFGSNPVPSSSSPAATPFKQVAYFVDPSAKNPYSMEYNFGIQREIGSSLVTLNYVGDGSRRLNLGGYYNVALTPGPGTPSARSPYPYITPTPYGRAWGRSSYQALEFLYNRQFSRGITFVASYTYSKSIDTGCSGYFGIEGCSVQDPYHFNNDRGPSAFDLTHILAINWLYKLPFGPGMRFQTGHRTVDYIIGTWQINGIVTIHSGPPYDVTVAGDIANTGNVNYERANLVGDPTLSNPEPAPGYWFNKAAFAAPSAFTFGNFGRDRLRSDYTRNFDLSVFRQFPLTESKSIELRAEMFNAFNTPTFAAPSSSFTSLTFGQVTSIANTPRQIQLALKILF